MRRLCGNICKFASEGQFLTANGSESEKRHYFIAKTDRGRIHSTTSTSYRNIKNCDPTRGIREWDKDERVHVLNMGVIENTPTGRLIVNIMMSFAEFERDMIVERKKEK